MQPQQPPFYNFPYTSIFHTHSWQFGPAFPSQQYSFSLQSECSICSNTFHKLKPVWPAHSFNLNISYTASRVLRIQLIYLLLILFHTVLRLWFLEFVKYSLLIKCIIYNTINIKVLLKKPYLNIPANIWTAWIQSSYLNHVIVAHSVLVAATHLLLIFEWVERFFFRKCRQSKHTFLPSLSTAIREKLTADTLKRSGSRRQTYMVSFVITASGLNKRGTSYNCYRQKTN